MQITCKDDNARKQCYLRKFNFEKLEIKIKWFTDSEKFGLESPNLNVWQITHFSLK